MPRRAATLHTHYYGYAVTAMLGEDAAIVLR